MITSAFVLPTGTTLGGVTTWSIKMVQKLSNIDKPAILVKHSEDIGVGILHVPEDITIVDCLGKPAYQAGLEDIISYLSTYNDILPATIIPNWSADTYATCALLSLTQAQNLRVIGIAHTDELDYYEWLQYYESIIHVFIAVSSDIGTKLKELLPHRANDIFVRPYSVEVPSELVQSSDLNLPLQLVYAGRLEFKQKRIDDLLKLIKCLEEKHVDYRFRIIGEGSQKVWLENQLRILPQHIFSKITLEAAIPHSKMADVWRKGDVCILVSEYEGTSVSMLEAMAYGCIPVTTQVSGTVAIIQEGINGFTVPIGDVEAMSRIIKNLDADRNNLRRIGENAYLTVKKTFSFEDYIPWFQELEELAWSKAPARWPSELSIHLPYKIQESAKSHLVYRALRKIKNNLFVPS